MAISVAVPVGESTANELIKRLVPRVEALKVGPSTDLPPIMAGGHPGAS